VKPNYVHVKELSQLVEITVTEPQYSKEDVDCLTKNIYFEARNQSIEGQFAVAEVVLNRTKDPQFPDDICEVIEQKSKNGCQFSWFCDGKKDIMKEEKAIQLATYVAVAILESPTDVTLGAKYYHADYVAPNWGKEKTVIIGDHVFYT
jgi:spore germination cell wall hydrolase CwlJ-like protein